MMAQTINLELPLQLYQHLLEAAEAAQQPLTEIAIQSIRVGLPPSLVQVPERFRDDLKVLNQLSNEVLGQIARFDLADDKAELYEELLAKNSQSELNEYEQTTLDNLRNEADLLMFRRSYAYTLLKWRGQRIPTLGEIQMP